MAQQTLVPKEFEIPTVVEAERFRLRMLTIHDVDKDFEAVTSSAEHLQKVWGGVWPQGLTREQNLIDLGWHQKEFQRRTSFTYTVVSPDESMVLGCVYIYPSRKSAYDAEVYFWARKDTDVNDLESGLEKTVRQWIKNDWPFEHPAFPGRDMSLEEWKTYEET